MGIKEASNITKRNRNLELRNINILIINKMIMGIALVTGESNEIEIINTMDI
jgi:hypothetical protein